MSDSAVIVLDPVNLAVMRAAHERGVKDYIGGNCTVSLMLMAVCGLLRAERGRNEKACKSISKSFHVRFPLSTAD